jgi:hypothetical protein
MPDRWTGDLQARGGSTAIDQFRGTMKHQHFGDIHDFRKYGLLRILQQHGDLQLLVAWMLTADDGGGDGRKRRYLEQPERWWAHDPELFDGIQDLLRLEGAPSITLLETSGLLPRTQFFSDAVPDARFPETHPSPTGKTVSPPIGRLISTVFGRIGCRSCSDGASVAT